VLVGVAAGVVGDGDGALVEVAGTDGAAVGLSEARRVSAGRGVWVGDGVEVGLNCIVGTNVGVGAAGGGGAGTDHASMARKTW
jgi:hypothetical protein